jgi:hypothetical protein
MLLSFMFQGLVVVQMCSARSGRVPELHVWPAVDPELFSPDLDPTFQFVSGPNL